MILKCTHLSTEQPDALINLFAEYEELFSRKLGCMPEHPVSLELKQEAKPLSTRPYTLPKLMESGMQPSLPENNSSYYAKRLIRASCCSVER